MTEHRAVFDFRITFVNGGEIAGRDFRLDVPGPDADRSTVGLLLVRHLGLLMVDQVDSTRSGSSRSRTEAAAAWTSRRRAIGGSSS